MKMNSTSFAGFLLATLILHCVLAVQNTDPENPKLSESPNKYASPQLYVFGGRVERERGSNRSMEYLSSASHFNSSTGKWKSTTGMSMAKSQTCGAVVGTKIYLFGGKDEHGETETAEVYDCETGTYSQFRSLPEPLRDCGAAVLGDFIYVAGGTMGGPSTTSVIRYNIKTTRIEDVSSMNHGRLGFELVALNNRLYAINGYYTNTTEMYNPTTDQWSFVASPHYIHRWFGAAVHEEKIYVCSDRGFEVYSPEADEWQILTPPNNYGGSKLVSMNGKLWALGGHAAFNSSTTSVSSYDTSTKIWTEQRDMDVARSMFSAFVVNH